MQIIGIILAGGLSRRMEGPDKAFVDIGGRMLVARVLDRLAPQCDRVVVNSNHEASLFKALGVPVVADDLKGFLGPVAGLLAGLDWIAAHHPDAGLAVTCAVDTPFLPMDLVARLRRAARASGTVAACAASARRRHPVAALWPVAARRALRAAFGRGERRLSSAIESLGCAVAEWPDAPFDPFLNVNSLQDLETARDLLPRTGGA